MDLATNRQANCLNTIRLLAALSVVYGHVCVHMNIALPHIFGSIIHFVGGGVPAFFAISGYLVWYSAKSSNGFGHYAKKRFWRIYPELWCAVIIEIIAIIIFFNGVIDWLKLAAFTFTQSSVLQFWTPDFLRNYGCGTPNGSLWTICVIIQFYLVAYLFAKLLKNAKLIHWICLIAAAMFISAAEPLIQGIVPAVIYKLYLQTLLPYFWLFALGAFICEQKDVALPFLKKSWYLFLIASAIVRIIGVDFGTSYGILRCSTMVVGLIGFSYVFPQLNIKLDISYGLYLYHMTVVNVMIVLGLTGNVLYLIIAFVASCALALVSTLTVGRWSQRRKSKI